MTIPDTVTTIGRGAFANCTGMTIATIGSGVTIIDSSAFFGCLSLASINVDSANQTYSSIDGVLFNKDHTTLIQFPRARSESYTIPDDVITIGDSAFSGSASLASVVIGSSVTTIGNNAFSGCTGLTNVTLENGLNAIGVSAFSGCTNLTGVAIPDSVTSIGNSAFSGCTGLAFATIGNGVTTIGDSAFYGCTGLTSVTIPNSVTTVGGGALSGCTSLTSVMIGSGVNNLYGTTNGSGLTFTSPNLPPFFFGLGPNAVPFSNCPNLASINVDSANQTYSSINGVLFNKDQTTLLQFPTARSGSYAIPETVTAIGRSAFSSCVGLTSVTIASGVTTIGDYAFYGCTGLTSVTIPNSVTTVGSGAFSGCTNLTSVAIGSGVNTLTPPGLLFLFSTFSNCPSLASINVDSANQTYSSIEGVLFNKDQSTLIQFPPARSGSYAIPEGATTIGAYAFYGCTGLTSVTIPNSVTTVGSGAFSGCSGLTSVTIGRGVTDLSPSSGFLFGPPIPFENCPNLASINVDSENQTYSSIDGVLLNKDQTTLIQFPPARSGSYAIPDSVTSISPSAFYGCTGLTSVTIGSNVTSLGRGGSIIVPSSTPSFPGGPTSGSFADLPAFSDCLNLAWIEVDTANQNYSSSGGVLFDKNRTTLIQFPPAKIGSYAVPEGVAAIGISAFSDAVGLSSLVIGSGVTSIGYLALDGCNGLNEILFRGAPPQNNPAALGSSATIYYLPEYASVWPPQFGGLPTALFAPKVALATINSANRFRFAWTGTAKIPMNVQRTTSLTGGIWTTIAVGVSIGDFTDPNPPQGTAFYRAVLP